MDALSPTPVEIRPALTPVVPTTYFAATRSFCVDQGTSCTLVFLSEAAQTGPGAQAVGVEVVLTPGAAKAFADNLRDVLKTAPEVPALSAGSRKKAPPKTWTRYGHTLGANTFVCSRAGDLCELDFYLVSPRALGNAKAENPNQTSLTLPASEVAAVGLNVWELAELAKGVERYVKGARSLLFAEPMVGREKRRSK